jgi:hypothetical protein
MVVCLQTKKKPTGLRCKIPWASYSKLTGFKNCTTYFINWLKYIHFFYFVKSNKSIMRSKTYSYFTLNPGPLLTDNDGNHSD